MRAPTPLFDFQDPDRSGHFAPVDGPAAGGPGRAEVSAGVLRFEGEAAPGAGDRGAAIRSSAATFDLSAATGVALRVRGDGRRYALDLGAGDGPAGVTWRAAFETATGGWEVILLPFDLFAPTAAGRPVGLAGSLAPARIRTVGLRLADGEAGPFRLEISAVAGYALERGAVLLPRPAPP
jgi:monofunctional biosynthetic peptidoglycan transglycosylase